MNRLITKVSKRNLMKFSKKKKTNEVFRCRVDLVCLGFRVNVKSLLSLWLPNYV